MENFTLSTLDDLEIIGYQWDLDSPSKVVCIIHGIGEHAGRYEKMAKMLNEHNIAVFAMDLRGHGKSGGVRGHCAPRRDVLLDVDELLMYASQKHNDCKTILYGHSMGGNIVLDYRNRGDFNDKVDGYIVSSPWVKLYQKVGSFQYFVIKHLAKIMPKFKINAKIKKEDLADVNNLKGYDKDELLHSSATLQCALEGFDIGTALYDDTLEIKRTGRRVPMLLMHGDKDKICSVEGSRKIAENQKEYCKYIEWKNMLHELHNGSSSTKGEVVIESIIDWIDKL